MNPSSHTLSLHRLTNFPWLSLPRTQNCHCHSLSQSLLVKVKVKVMLRPTVSRCLSWNEAPTWGLRLDSCYCQTFEGLLMWGALSDGRTYLSFTIAADPRQRSHSRVRVPWDSRPYFTLSDLRLSFSSPLTTRRATVEVFDPASTLDLFLYSRSTNPTENTASIV
jgi:hypothetical protein